MQHLTMTDDDLDALLATGELPDALAQRADESAVAYATFLRYLRLGHTRSIHALAVAEHRDERWLERLSSKYGWRARLALYQRLRLRAQLLDILREACETTVPDVAQMPDAA
jgi:hypothetical protein